MVVKRDRFYGSFEKIELRIGFMDISASGQVELAGENLFVGCSGSPNINRDHYFNLEQPVSGRYLTIQTRAAKYLAMDEIYVFN